MLVSLAHSEVAWHRGRSQNRIGIMDVYSILSIIGTIILAATGLAALIWSTTSRLGSRLSAVERRISAVEKETSRLSGHLEGLGLAGRFQPTNPAE